VPLDDASLERPAATSDAATERVRSDVVRAVRKVCPSWLADHADDFAQVVTTRILGRMKATGGQVEFSQGYLYRAAYSAVVDEIRKRRRLREVSVEEVGESVMPTSRHGSESVLARLELRDALLQCLARLIVVRRRAVMLHLQGHSVADISALLECDRRRAENLTYRGLADVRACLAAQGLSR
jgi:RNA polymerase sigma-70 factor (ECF subfamily)